MKYIDFLDDNAKKLHSFFASGDYSFKDIALGLALEDLESKLAAQRISLMIFPSQTDENGKRKMRRLNGNDMLSFCVAYSLVIAQLASTPDVAKIYTTLHAGVNGDDEFARNGDVSLSQAPSKAMDVLHMAYPLAGVWYHPSTMLVCSPLLSGGDNSWRFGDAPLRVESPATLVLLVSTMIPIVSRLQTKHALPNLGGNGMFEVAVVTQ